MTKRKRIRNYVFHIGRWTVVIARWVLYVNIGIFLALASLLVVARIWLPTLVNNKAEIEDFLTSKTSYSFKIDSLSAYWDGIYPGVIMNGLRISDKQGKNEILKFNEVKASIAVQPLWRGSLQLGRITIVRPEMELERSQEGEIHLRGVSAGPSKKNRSSIKAFTLLAKLNEVVIQDGTVLWTDKRDSTKILEVQNVNLALSGSGKLYKVSIGAKFPENICLSCYVSVEYDSTKITKKLWDGEIYIHTVGLVTDNLPLVIRELIPKSFSGKFDVLLRSNISNNQIKSTHGYVKAADLTVPIAENKTFYIDEIQTTLDWVSKKDGWTLETEELEFKLKNEVWNAEKLDINYKDDQSIIFLKHLDLERARVILESIPFEHDIKSRILEIEPKGFLSDVSLRFEGQINEPRDFSLQAQLSDFAILPYKKYPGIDGLSGKILLSKNSGSFIVDSNLTRVSLPGVFRSPLDIRKATGTLRWTKDEEKIEIYAQKVDLNTEDIDGSVKIRFVIPRDKEQSPYINLRADIENSNLRNVSRYYPVNKLKPKLLEWLDHAIVGGTASTGYAIIDGNIKDFPFTENNGTFKAVVNIEDGEVDYLAGMPSIHNAEILLQFEGNQMLISCREGRIGGLDINRVVVSSDNLKRKPAAMIDISGQLFGSVDTGLNALRESRFRNKEPTWVKYINPGIRGAGLGGSSLQLTFNPKLPKQTQVRGEYRFENSTLFIPVANLKATAIQGDLYFDNAGIGGGLVQANIMGGQSLLTISREFDADDQKETIVDIKGKYTDTGLIQAFGDWLEPRISGQGTWSGRMLVNNAGQNYHFVAETKDLEIKLPAPLGKKLGAHKPLVVGTRTSRTDRHVVDFKLADLANGVMLFRRESNQWLLWGTHLALADAKSHIPTIPKLEISANSDFIDADIWRKVFVKNAGSGVAIPDFLVRMNGDFKSMYYLDRELGLLNINMNRKAGEWHGELSGDALKGTFKAFFGRPYNRFGFDLEYFRFASEPDRNTIGAFDPSELQGISIKSDNFQYGQRQLGRLDMAGVPITRGWQLSRLTINNPSTMIFAKGEMTHNKKGTSGEFEVFLDSTDIGATLLTLSLPSQITGGSATVKSDLSWDRVERLDLANLKAMISVSAKEGQFVSIEQGAGKALGFVDPAAVARYLRLDFRPIFGKGYSFDKMKGNIRMEKGSAYTHDMLVKGPSADVRVSGRIGFADQDYDLIVGINPSLTDKLAIASWGLGAPQLGAAVLLFKKIFKKQTKEAQQLTYTVKGSWDKPIMARVGEQVESSQTDPLSSDSESD